MKKSLLFAAALFALGGAGTAHAQDNLLNVTPSGTMKFTLDKCESVTRPLVIKNPTDEVIDIYIASASNADVVFGDTVFEYYENSSNKYIPPELVWFC